MKLKNVKDKALFFYCPGCEEMHSVNSTWEFNNDYDKPTLKPSILVKKYDGDKVIALCHSFITDGKIQFLSDCTHELKGQTVELPDIEEDIPPIDPTISTQIQKVNSIKEMKDE
jgi:hypothetical protein